VECLSFAPRHGRRWVPDKLALPETLIQAIQRRGAESLHSLTAVSNNAGKEGHAGLALLIESGQLDRLIMSYLGANKLLEKQYLTGKIAVELCPQGTLAERIRAAGSGIPAFFTPTGGRKLQGQTQLAERGLLADPFCRHSGGGGTNTGPTRRERQCG
jgi:acyl CoA:acetate/3-ketoacid CoA transferase alpha subunit